VLTFFLFFALHTVDETGFQKLVNAHKGKVVLYDFWATWCSGCREEMPKLITLEQQLKARGFELVTISADDPEQDADAEKVLHDFHAPEPGYRKQAVKDEQFINAIDPKWSGALPALFLYDRHGVKVQSFIGETDPKTIADAVNKLL
jgi:thiol-disulfide isomerase/thioredoxin